MPFTRAFLFLRNRELSVKGDFQDNASLLHLSIAMGWETMMIGFIHLLKKAKRYSLRIV